MEEQDGVIKKNIMNTDIGSLLWHLEEIENFYPCYITMISKKEK
jgi:hypothetical protein